MARAPVRTRTKPRAGTLEAGPFRGCRDSTDPTTADPSLARSLVNMYRASGPDGAAQFGRPGFDDMGAAAGTVVQAVLTWTLVTGVRQTVKVMDGELYDYDWVGGTWTRRVTTANLASNSVTLSATARVALVPFADGLTVHDGVNTPFSWNGAAGAGGITKGTNVPVFYGVPTVKDSSLIGIKANARGTIAWSEPGEWNVGYEATIGVLTYNNAWDNPGGYPDPLEAVAGENEALYVFRARSSVAILNPIGPDMATSPTKANVSPDIGTASPWAVLTLTQGVFVVDADANPWLVRVGQPEPLALWKDCLQATKNTPRASLPQTLAVYDEATASVLLGLPTASATYAVQWLCFHVDDLQYNGPWTWSREAFCAGTIIDADGVKRWAHADALGGYVLAHGTPTVDTRTDSIAGVATAIQHEERGPFLGFDPEHEFHVHRGHFGFTGDPTTVEVSYETSRGQSLPQTIALNTGGLGFTLDVDQLDLDTIGDPVIHKQATVGFAGRGRWLSLIARHTVLGEAFGCDVMRAHIATTQGNPGQP